MNGLYAGSFDPFHKGHEAVLKTAVKLFTHVRILIAINPNKKYFFTEEERINLITQWISKEHLDGKISIDMISLGKSVVSYAVLNNFNFLIRGIRGVDDVSAEMTLSEVNQNIGRKKLDKIGCTKAPTPETVWIPKPINISSSMIREVINLKDSAWAEVTAEYIPKSICGLFVKYTSKHLTAG